MTWIMVMIITMMMMVTLSDTASTGEIGKLKTVPSKDRMARQIDSEDGTKEGDRDFYQNMKGTK